MIPSEPVKNMQTDGYTRMHIDDLHLIYDLTALPIDQMCNNSACPSHNASALITIRYLSAGTVRKHKLNKVDLSVDLEPFLTTTSFDVDAEQLDEILASLLKAAIVLRDAEDRITVAEPHKDDL